MSCQRRLAPLKARRDELEVASREIDRDVLRLTSASEQIESLRGELAEKDAAILDLQRSAEVIDVDERVLAVAPELSALLEDASGFRQRLDAIANAESAADDAERRIAAGPAIPSGARDSAENRAAVESWRDRLAKLQADCRLGAAGRDADRRQGNRSGVCRRRTSSRPGRKGQGSARGLRSRGDRHRGCLRRRRSSPRASTTARLGARGCRVRARRRGAGVGAVAERARCTCATAHRRGGAAARRCTRQRACSPRPPAPNWKTAKAEWREWLAERELDTHGEDPAAVRQFLDEIKDRDALAAEAARYRADASRERERAEEWVVRLVDLIRQYDDTAGQIPPLSAALELAARARATLDRARAAQDERAEILRDLSAADVVRQRPCRQSRDRRRGHRRGRGEARVGSERPASGVAGDRRCGSRGTPRARPGVRAARRRALGAPRASRQRWSRQPHDPRTPETRGPEGAGGGGRGQIRRLRTCGSPARSRPRAFRPRAPAGGRSNRRTGVLGDDARALHRRSHPARCRDLGRHGRRGPGAGDPALAPAPPSSSTWRFGSA